jgi:hypothetical protein
MSVVSTQPPTAASEVLPAGQAPIVPVSQAGNNTHPNDNNSSAVNETPVPGASWGVDLEGITDSESLNRAIEGMGLPELPPEGTQTVPTPTVPAQIAPAEDALTRPGEMPRNLKMPIRDEVDWKVQSLIKDARLNNREMTYAQAEHQALAALGRAPVEPLQSIGHEPAPIVPESLPPAENADLDAAYADYQAARQAFDDEAEVNALRRINALERDHGQAAIAATAQAAKAQQEAQTDFDARWNDTVSTVQRVYADAANPESALSQRAAEIQQAYAASTDPSQLAIYHSPNSAMLYYQLAAMDLQVQPSPAPAPIPSQKSTPQLVPGNRPPMSAYLAGGQPGNAAPAPPGFDLNRITDSHDLDALIEAQAGRWAA